MKLTDMQQVLLMEMANGYDGSRTDPRTYYALFRKGFLTKSGTLNHVGIVEANKIRTRRDKANSNKKGI